MGEAQIHSLFSVSYWGSAAGLTVPIFLLSPFIKNSQQILFWEIGIAIYLALFAVIILYFVWKRLKFVADPFKIKINPLWIYCPFLTSALMLSVTNFISFGIGSAPLTWMVPLLIFLVSFAIVFSERILVDNKKINFLLILWVTILVISNVMTSHNMLWVEMSGYYLFLFIATLIVNRHLHQIRPQNPLEIGSFNLSLNLGGLLGTFFVAFGAPYLGRSFSNVYAELFYSIALLALFFLFRDGKKQWVRFQNAKLFIKVSISICTFVLLFFVIKSGLAFTKQDSLYSRNFYGIKRITTRDDVKILVHGRTGHGGQYSDVKRSKFPLFYYHPKGPIGVLLQTIDRPLNVGLVGLGVGSLAYYAQPNEEWTFFEIDPDVYKIAKEQFTFLKDSKVPINVIIGDARLQIEKFNGVFDLLILDAFSGDSIPRHLLTIEAFQIYLAHLKTDGTIAVHISNSFLKLESVLVPLAKELKLKHLYVKRGFKDELGSSGSQWIFLSNNQKVIDLIRSKNRGVEKVMPESFKPWTDELMNIFVPLFYKD